MFSSEMLPQVDGDKIIRMQLQLFLNEKFFIILYSRCYSMQLLLKDCRLEVMETIRKTEMLFQATFVNMLILKAHFHLFWMHASMNCTHVSGLANHFIFGIGSINILCILTDDYDNWFYQILPRNCEIFGNWTSL